MTVLGLCQCSCLCSLVVNWWYYTYCLFKPLTITGWTKRLHFIRASFLCHLMLLFCCISERHILQFYTFVFHLLMTLKITNWMKHVGYITKCRTFTYSSVQRPVQHQSYLFANQTSVVVNNWRPTQDLNQISSTCTILILSNAYNANYKDTS